MQQPIALFAYNRPNHLKLALTHLDRSLTLSKKEHPLYLFCDAPSRPEHEEAVSLTIKVAKEWGKGEVIVRDKNLRFKNITEGITSLCNTYGRAILIEDDVIVSPDFIPYISEALERYEEDPSLFLVSGFMYQGAYQKLPKTLFLPSAFIWGWATWKRAWDKYSWNAPGWEEFLKDKKACYTYDYFGACPFSKMLKKTMRGEWNTWDAQWMYTVFKERGAALYPSTSLVWNCGVGGGTHGKALHSDPRESLRERYLHGTLNLEDFETFRLFAPGEKSRSLQKFLFKKSTSELFLKSF